MKGLFDRESEAGNLMVQVRRADLETRLTPEVTRKRTRRQIASRECLGAREARTSYGVNIDLKHIEVQGVVLDEVPSVAAQLPLYIVNDAWGSIDVQGAIPPKDRPEEMVKTDEMI
jgi:hypothetical protein